MSKAWLLPDVIDPAETVCVTIEVPDDDTHIQAFFGALQELAYSYNWEWDGIKSGLAVARVWERQIDIAAQQVRTGVNCMLDCDDVEDCLETSTIIGVIEGDIVNHTTLISDNTTELTYISENPPDGNVYPEPPDVDVEPDAACGAAFYMVAQLRAFIVELEGYPVTYPTLIDAMEALLLGEISLAILAAQGVLASLYDPAPPPSVLIDFDAQQDTMRKQLYCEGFDKGAFSTWARGALTSGDAIADFIDCVAFGTWASWIAIGEVDDTQDCSSFVCGTWCYEWNNANGWTGWTVDSGTDTIDGYESDLNNLLHGGAIYNNWVQLTHPQIASATRIVVEFSWTGMKNTHAHVKYNVARVGLGSLGFANVPSGYHDPNPSTKTVDALFDGTEPAIFKVTAMTGQWNGTPIDTGGYECYIESITVYGTGINPFGVDNCV